MTATKVVSGTRGSESATAGRSQWLAMFADTAHMQALRATLGYRIYRDFKHGWRLTSPNLEQCGLLDIGYVSLDEVCSAADLWERAHSALATASAETQRQVCKVLQDYMRRSLAIQDDYLDPIYQDGLKQQSSQYLKTPWALDEMERLSRGAVLYHRPCSDKEAKNENAYLSARGGFSQYLRRNTTFPNISYKITLSEIAVIIQQLLNALVVGDLVKIVDEAKNGDNVNGYQIPASALIWRAGDGTKAFHDPISVPRLPEGGGCTKSFFVEFYQGVASKL